MIGAWVIYAALSENRKLLLFLLYFLSVFCVLLSDCSYCITVLIVLCVCLIDLFGFILIFLVLLKVLFLFLIYKHFPPLIY